LTTAKGLKRIRLFLGLGDSMTSAKKLRELQKRRKLAVRDSTRRAG
jgi:hypothetical protein